MVGWGEVDHAGSWWGGIGMMGWVMVGWSGMTQVETLRGPLSFGRRVAMWLFHSKKYALQ